jgi:hypothetical protein
MNLPTEAYTQQVNRWPADGRHILAHFDDETIIVYQAYRPAIGRFAIEWGFFGGPFSYSRMSWIKPNFLWMMYRSGWGTKEGQEIVLGVRLSRTFFDSILAESVQSSYQEGHYRNRDDWRTALSDSSVRLQWDPDHDPCGEKLARRAVQLGLRGDVLAAYGKRECKEIIDMTTFVAEQRAYATSPSCAQLHTPLEREYVPSDSATAAKLGLEMA